MAHAPTTATHAAPAPHSSASATAAAAPEILIANGKYKLGRRLGSGSFGEVFEGRCVETGAIVAVKLESVRSLGGSQLVYEYNIYRILKGRAGVPAVLYFGKEGQYNIMIMDLLGPNLEDLLTYCGGKLTVKTVCMLALQLIQRLEDVHSKGLLHRDIKPENFLVGLGKNAGTCYIIDFGLAKKYIDSKTKQHMEYSSHKDLTGTVRYASLNAHLGIAQSRRDDLESLGFLFVYFLKGCLPWQGLKADTKKKKYEKVLKMKIETSIDVLTKGCPEEVRKYLIYCRELRFEQKPDYQYLRRLFTELFTRSKFVNDGHFDWTMPEKPDAKAAAAAAAAQTVPPVAPAAAAGGGGGIVLNAGAFTPLQPALPTTAVPASAYTNPVSVPLAPLGGLQVPVMPKSGGGASVTPSWSSTAALKPAPSTPSAPGSASNAAGSATPGSVGTGAAVASSPAPSHSHSHSHAHSHNASPHPHQHYGTASAAAVHGSGTASANPYSGSHVAASGAVLLAPSQQSQSHSHAHHSMQSHAHSVTHSLPSTPSTSAGAGSLSLPSTPAGSKPPSVTGTGAASAHSHGLLSAGLLLGGGGGSGAATPSPGASAAHIPPPDPAVKGLADAMARLQQPHSNGVAQASVK